jgi:hypothetical protein
MRRNRFDLPALSQFQARPEIMALIHRSGIITIISLPQTSSFSVTMGDNVSVVSDNPDCSWSKLLMTVHRRHRQNGTTKLRAEGKFDSPPSHSLSNMHCSVEPSPLIAYLF